MTETNGKNSKLILAAMIFAVSMTFIDMTIVSIALPELQKDLALSSTGVQWVVNAYLLSLAALFLLLRAEFVAAAQVVVYAGAVMVLYVFVVAYVGAAEPAHLKTPIGGGHDAAHPRPAAGTQFGRPALPLAEELVLWSTPQFAFMRIGESFTSASSIPTCPFTSANRISASNTGFRSSPASTKSACEIIRLS